MQKLLFICLMFLLAKFTLAQDPKVTSIINFTGTVGTYPIEMQFRLVQQTDSIDGEYYYVKSGRDNKIFLKGTFKNGNLLLQESAYDSKSKKFLSSGYFKIATIKNTTVFGTWGKNKVEADNPNALKVQLVCRENLNVFNPFKFKFNMIKQKANYENMPHFASSYYSLKSLKIVDNSNNSWTLTDFKEDDLVALKGELELEDMNFDGYLDLKIWTDNPGVAKGDYNYLYYIYDKKQARFLKNKVLDDIGVLFFDASKKTVFKYDADGRGNEGTTTYKWFNGILFMIKEERVYEDDSYIHFKEYKVINGKSVVTKEYKTKEGNY